MPWKLTFRPLGVGRFAVVTFISILCLLFSAFTVSAVIATPSILGAVFMCAAAFFVGWIWYWFMHRFSLETSLDDEKLAWKTGFRSGVMPLNEIENMRRSLGTKIEIESATMRITMLPAGGYELFLQEIILLRPDLALPKRPLLPIQTPRRGTLTYED